MAGCWWRASAPGVMHACRRPVSVYGPFPWFLGSAGGPCTSGCRSRVPCWALAWRLVGGLGRTPGCVVAPCESESAGTVFGLGNPTGRYVGYGDTAGSLPFTGDGGRGLFGLCSSPQPGLLTSAETVANRLATGDSCG